MIMAERREFRSRSDRYLPKEMLSINQRDRGETKTVPVPSRTNSRRGSRHMESRYEYMYSYLSWSRLNLNGGLGHNHVVSFSTVHSLLTRKLSGRQMRDGTSLNQTTRAPGHAWGFYAGGLGSTRTRSTGTRTNRLLRTVPRRTVPTPMQRR